MRASIVRPSVELHHNRDAFRRQIRDLVFDSERLELHDIINLMLVSDSNSDWTFDNKQRWAANATIYLIIRLSFTG
jgi:hypothetical protein